MHLCLLGATDGTAKRLKEERAPSHQKDPVRELPIQGGAIGTKIDGVSEYIDELAQLVSDFTDSMPASAKSHPPSSPIEALLTSFMAGMTKPNHGPTQDEWEILENQENPPNETQDKSD